MAGRSLKLERKKKENVPRGTQNGGTISSKCDSLCRYYYSAWDRILPVNLLLFYCTYLLSSNIYWLENWPLTFFTCIHATIWRYIFWIFHVIPFEKIKFIDEGHTQKIKIHIRDYFFFCYWTFFGVRLIRDLYYWYILLEVT